MPIDESSRTKPMHGILEGRRDDDDAENACIIASA